MDSSRAQEEVSLCLAAIEAGDPGAVDRLLPHIYADLRELAGRVHHGRAGVHTLQPTALVHEAYMRLVKPPDSGYENRLHFLGVAAIAMRQIMSSYAKQRRAQKRGGGRTVVALIENDAAQPNSGRELDLVALDEALTKLQETNERQARTVELRYLMGLTVDETAEVLGVSPRTVKADWHIARRWLHRQLGEDEEV